MIPSSSPLLHFILQTAFFFFRDDIVTMHEALSCTIFLLFFFFFFAATTAGGGTGHRRRLHQPFFIPPVPPELPRPPLHSNPKSSPFFPLDSPPTPPSLPTFPTDVSDHLPHHQHPSPHLLLLIPALLLLLLVLVAAAAATAVILRRRRRLTPPDDSKSESRRLFPPDADASDGRTVPAGAFGSSRRVDSASSPYRKFGSPELRPLPPLPPRLFRRGSRRSDDEGEEEEDEEEFDSPRGLPAEKESSGLVSSASRSGFPAMEASSSSASRSPAVLGTMKSPTLSSFSRSRASASPAWLSSESSIMSPPTSSPTMPALNRAPPAIGSWDGQGPHVAPAVTTATDDDAAEVTTAKPKLKPLLWDKLKASSDRAMVWDQMRSSSFRLNEKMMEALSVRNATPTPKGVFKKPGIPSTKEDTRMLDPKKSQSIAILLRALNVTKEEVCEALLEGNMENLSSELLETLVKMTPTKEEEIKLKDYHDDSPVKLGPAERFLKAVIDIPFAFKRIDAMLYIANFDSEVKYLERSFETLENACKELRNSRMFHKLREAVLMTSNRMNVGTIRGVAHTFKLDTLLKLVDIRGTDGKTTLLHFVVQEIIQLEGSRIASSTVDSELRKIGLQVVAGLSSELSNVKKAAGMDSNVLGGYVSKLAGGIGKIREVLRLSESTKTQGSSLKFSQSMSNFLNKAEEEITRVQAHQSVALSLVKEMIEYFLGDISKEEAHLFRLFTVVRDFLDFLDGVCTEVGIINQKTNISSLRELTVPVRPISIFPVLPSYVRSLDSSDNDDSPSS